MPKYEMIINVHLQDMSGPDEDSAKEFIEGYLTHVMGVLATASKCKATVSVEHIEEQT